PSAPAITKSMRPLATSLHSCDLSVAFRVMITAAKPPLRAGQLQRATSREPCSSYTNDAASTARFQRKHRPGSRNRDGRYLGKSAHRLGTARLVPSGDCRRCRLTLDGFGLSPGTSHGFYSGVTP